MKKNIFILLLILSIIFPTAAQETAAQPSAKVALSQAAVFKENGEYEKAIAALEGFLATSEDGAVRKYLGSLYYLSGKPLLAYKNYKKVKEKDWESAVYMGLIFEALDKKEAAIEWYRRSLALKKNGIALTRLGKIYYQNREYEEAATVFSELIQFDPSIRLANYYLGDCLFKINDYKQAYSYAARGINFYPDNEKMKEQLLQVKSKLDDTFFTELRRMIDKTRRTVKLMFYKRTESAPLITVGIGKDLSKFSFRGGDDYSITDGTRTMKARKDKLYTLVYKKKNAFVLDYDTGAVLRKFTLPLRIKSNLYSFYVLDVVYGRGNFWHKEIDRMYRGDLRVIPSDRGMTLTNVINVQEYLYGVLPSEIPATAAPEVLRAQAIAARTIALKGMGRHKKEGFDVCSQVHCQAYQGLSAETPATNRAVDDTRGEIIVETDQPIETFYHANCGGCSRSDLFGKAHYLVNKLDAPQGITQEVNSDFTSAYGQERWMRQEPLVFCAYPKSSFRWQRAYDAEDFALAFGFPLSRLKNIVPAKKGEAAHYDALTVAFNTEKVTLSGDLKIREYFDKLRSSAFRVEIVFSPQKKPVMLLFWGAGFGHAVGLCQEGAMAMASQGYTYEEILRHYYPNTKIKTTY
ncbi:MAG: SpoIID/LytB domain-containing protein [Candidatus Omnitrophota bacterium]|nr:SpoIID/LytB domain-containing protein [Candidatus Omnitrophota bacterium]